MAEEKPGKPGARRVSAPFPAKGKKPAREKPGGPANPGGEGKPDDRSLVWRLSDLTGSALRFAAKTTGTSLKIGKAFLSSADKKKLVEEAGHSLRDLRLVAGLTVNELSESLDLRDKSFLEAVEDGTATLSFELILRLASLLARHDPIPFVIKYTRTYDPEVWKVLKGWGLGRIPLQYERERQFINIYRSRDAVRKLSDEDFVRLLGFVQSAFDLALHFIVGEEGAKGTRPEEED